MKTIRQLFTETFKADPQEMMNTMSWHETGPNQRLNPKAVQQINKRDEEGRVIKGEFDEGAGKGKYQFEAPALKDAFRLLKMTYREAGSKDDDGEWKYPDWIEEAENETDARELTEAQQDELFLANLMMKKNSDADIIRALDDGDYKNLWLVHHWGGSAGSKGFTDKQLKQVSERETAFDESAGSYKQFKVEMEKQQRQQFAMMNQVMNNNPLQADKEVVKEPEPKTETEVNEAEMAVLGDEYKGRVTGAPDEYK